MGIVYMWTRLARQALDQYKLHSAIRQQPQSQSNYASMFYAANYPLRVGSRLQSGLSQQDACVIDHDSNLKADDGKACTWPHRWSSFPPNMERVPMFDAYRGDVSDLVSLLSETRDEITQPWAAELLSVGRDMNNLQEQLISGAIVPASNSAQPQQHHQPPPRAPQRSIALPRAPAITYQLRCAYVTMILSRDSGFLLAAEVLLQLA